MWIKEGLFYLVGFFVVCLAVCIALSIGRYSIAFDEVVLTLIGRGGQIEQNIIFAFRMPHVITAVCVGAGLSLAGAAFQSLFKNPLAAPDILGVVSGASFGCVLALLFGLGIVFVSVMGFVFGIVSTLLVMLIGYNKHAPYDTTSMVLAGLIISALFQSLIGIVKYIADPQDTLPMITYWLLGSFDVSLESHVVFSLIGIVCGSGVLFCLRWKLNLLMLSDDEAKSLGVNLVYLRTWVICASTMIVACAVSICGIIGWVGLLVPHIARLLCGSENTRLIPLTTVLGAVFLVVIDSLSRTLASEQIPISILTSLVGAPFFIYILRKNTRN